MAKTKNSNNDFINGAAEVVGGALGTIAGTIDRLKADHPHPVEEAKEALAAGQAQLTDLAADAKNRTSSLIESMETAIALIGKQASQSRRKGRKIVRKAKRATRKAKRVTRRTVKRAKRIVRRARKKVVGRARKTAAKSRARTRRK